MSVRKQNFKIGNIVSIGGDLYVPLSPHEQDNRDWEPRAEQLRAIGLIDSEIARILTEENYRSAHCKIITSDIIRARRLYVKKHPKKADEFLD